LEHGRHACLRPAPTPLSKADQERERWFPLAVGSDLARAFDSGRRGAPRVRWRSVIWHEREVQLGVRRVGDLEVNQDPEYQRRTWIVQRVGWVLMCLIVLAALLGLTGRGPLSTATAGLPDGPLRVEYQRFDRHRAPSEFQILLPASEAPNGQVRVWIDRGYLSGVEIQTIVPEPESVEIGEDRVTYSFNVNRAGPPVRLGFRVTYDGFGPKRGGIGLEDGEPVTFGQFIYP
jgi:hypothetical protein